MLTRSQTAVFAPALGSVALACVLASGCARPLAPGSNAGEAVRLPEHYAHSIAALGYPGAYRAFQVGHGSVVGTGECALEWRLDGGGEDVQTSPVWFERDGVPVAHWTMTSPGRRIRFEAAAVPSEGLGDTSLACSVRATAECVGEAPIEVALEVRVRSLPEGPHAVPWDAPGRWRFEEAWRGHDALRDGRLVAKVDRAARIAPGAPTAARPSRVEGTGVGALIARCAARLAPGERQSWDFWIPLYPLGPRDRTAGRDAGHDRAIARTRDWWRGSLGRAAGFETPDTLVNLAWRAALVTLVQCQQRDGGRWVPIGNPFQYRDVWIRDGARVVRALSVAGLAEYARDGARTLTEYQLPSGVLLSQRGQLDGTGQALWAFEQASALAEDPALARELLPVAERALQWIARQRAATTTLGLPGAGLLPYGDPRDGELVVAQLVGNDAWTIAGCDAVAALARRAGDNGLAARAAAQAADYRLTFVAALARVRHPDLPPSYAGPGRDWGNTSVAYPTRALPPGDRRFAALARRMLARGGDTGLTCYGPDDSLHSYGGSDLAQWALLADRPALARGWLAGVLAHSSSTLGQAEIFSRRDGGFGANLPPHTTAAAALVDLLRNFVLSDLGDTLELALGADTTWWRGTRLERAPTRFGITTVTLDRPAPDRLRVRLGPLPAPLRVRVPDGLRATGATSPGARVVSDGWVEAPARATEVWFAVARRNPPG